MTVGRMLAGYLAAGAALAMLLVVADGERGLRAAVAAWVICLVPLVRWPHRRVAAGDPGTRTADKWGLLQTGTMLFRLAWVLGAGAVLYHVRGDRLGVGFWVALIALYQVMLALSVVRLLRPAGRPANDGDTPSDVPGR